MSDLNAGRYAEAWLPSNLIFDQFAVDLDIALAAHSVITNGQVTVLGPGHWRVLFADQDARDPCERHGRARHGSGHAAALGERRDQGLEADRLDDEPARIADVGALLTANEHDYGRYLASRFVVFFHGAGGGMEYNGATTTSGGALAHETFHSWFARGVTPSSQADGWWDEGFTTFRDSGADDPLPFDFADDPVVLCSRLPFQPKTAGNAYTDGSRFFQGVASAPREGRRLRAQAADAR